MAPIRVLICDDSLGFPSLVRAWLRNAGEDFEAVGTAKGGEEAKVMAAELQPDVILLDLLLPDVPDPTALVRDLRAAAPDMKIVLISSLHMKELDNAARAARVDGVCNKGSTEQELIGTIYGVTAGSVNQNRLP